MVLHLHVADRTDRLADALADLLGAPQPDPFASELVVVPAKGVERWLTQRLSHRLGAGPAGGDGVCAGVDLVSPRSLVATLTGTERTDPWDPERLVWPVLDAVDASLGEPWCATLARHLGEGRSGEELRLRRGRRWSVARRLAGLLAAYAVQRPALLRAWGDGRDEDGHGRALEDDLRWQAPLWRAVTARVDAPPPHVRHARTLEAVAAGSPLALPTRLSLFGHTRLPRTEVELLAAVGAVREVHLWLPTPSPVLWEALAPLADEGVLRREDDRSAQRVGHPLLSSLGRDARELRRTLGALEAPRGGPATEVRSAVLAPTPAPDTLLGRLQHDLRHDHEPTATERAARVVAPDDRSVQVHAAHGPARQVEVLRDVLVGLLDDDPTLEPRDVVVMCPDIDVYAPLFHAAFGLGGVVGAGDGGHPAHRLRLRLADRGLATTNPFLALAADLLALASGRATLSEVLALAASGPVRHRFALGDDDLDTIATWAEEAGVRWGLTAPLRDDYGLAAVEDNTWRAGLDRLLVGVAVAETSRLVGDVLPLDDVASAQVDLAGRVAELVDRVEAAVEDLRAADDLATWVTVLHDAVRGLGSAPPQDAWQVAQLERELRQVREAGAEGDGRGPRLGLADLRALLEDRTAGRPTRASFRTGALTVCTMVPMRSVPHRVVALVGLDDGVFPRASAVDGDDVLGRHPLTGERDARSEDRQLLLDAVLAATETLVVTYTGANEVSGQERPPAVPLGELLDALDTTATTPDGRPVHEHVVVRHPLQPYDARTVTPGALLPGRDVPFTFDRAALVGAQASLRRQEALAGGSAAERTERSRPGPLLTRPLPPARGDEVALTVLHEALEQPARAFLRHRLDVAVPREERPPSDAVPLDLDALQQWAVGDRLLAALLDGADPEAAVDAERRRGALPPGELAHGMLSSVARRAGLLVERTAVLRVEPARSIDIDLALPGGRRLTGVVTGLRGDRLVRVHYSSLGARHRLASWVDLLAVAAQHPGRPWIAATVGWRGGREQQPTARRLDAPDDALEVLVELLDLHDRALREPLPMPVRTAAAWAEAADRRRPAELLARKEWETDAEAPVPGEQDDAANVAAFGPKRSFAELKNLGSGAEAREAAGEPARAEAWNDEPCRLGRLAVRLWAPLLRQERTVPL